MFLSPAYSIATRRLRFNSDLRDIFSVLVVARAATSFRLCANSKGGQSRQLSDFSRAISEFLLRTRIRNSEDSGFNYTKLSFFCFDKTQNKTVQGCLRTVSCFLLFYFLLFAWAPAGRQAFVVRYSHANSPLPFLPLTALLFLSFPGWSLSPRLQSSNSPQPKPRLRMLLSQLSRDL